MSQCLLSTEARAIPAGRMLHQGLVSGVTQPVVGGAICIALMLFLIVFITIEGVMYRSSEDVTAQ